MSRWTSLSFNNREWRMPILADLIEKSADIELVDGTLIKLALNSDLIAALKAKDLTTFNIIRNSLCDTQGNKIRISELGKTQIFGGLGIGNSREMLEQPVIEKLNTEIEKVAPITIFANSKYHYDIIGAKKSKQHARSDIELFDINSETLLWVSHKSGNTVNDFQQWSGIKHFKEHKEVQHFIDVVCYWLEKNNYDMRGTILTRSIQDNELKLRAIYGADYNSQYYGLQNVNYVIQGDIVLNKCITYFKLTSSNGDTHVHQNGYSIIDNYEPAFYARFDSKAHTKNKFYLHKTRILIFPKGRIRGKNVVKI